MESILIFYGYMITITIFCISFYPVLQHNKNVSALYIGKTKYFVLKEFIIGMKHCAISFFLDNSVVMKDSPKKENLDQ